LIVFNKIFNKICNAFRISDFDTLRDR